MNICESAVRQKSAESLLPETWKEFDSEWFHQSYFNSRTIGICAHALTSADESLFRPTLINWHAFHVLPSGSSTLLFICCFNEEQKLIYLCNLCWWTKRCCHMLWSDFVCFVCLQERKRLQREWWLWFADVRWFILNLIMWWSDCHACKTFCSLNQLTWRCKCAALSSCSLQAAARWLFN